jgi:prepilin-type N-terminal cleavage/methylation domain-containing protein
VATLRRRQAGFTLIEVMIVLAITLLIAALVYKVTRASWLLYQTQTQVTERGFSGVRAIDDMAAWCVLICFVYTEIRARSAARTT